MTTTNDAMEAELKRLFARLNADSSGYIEQEFEPSCNCSAAIRRAKS
ncbi:MAG: hypothetical protein U5K38_05185 [Woeseiaceae bacterium]|nr:hypothetical protein [Woeseiaceae bacterium]